MKTPQELILEHLSRDSKLNFTELKQIEDFKEIVKYYDGSPIRLWDKRFTDNVIEHVKKYGWIVIKDFRKNKHNEDIQWCQIITH